MSLADEQWLKEHMELKGITPAALLQLAKQNPPEKFRSGPVAALKYLVNQFVRKSKPAVLHKTTADAPGIERLQIIEAPRCAKCRGAGQISETEYCDCSQGAEVKRAADRIAAEKARRAPPCLEGHTAAVAKPIRNRMPA